MRFLLAPWAKPLMSVLRKELEELEKSSKGRFVLYVSSSSSSVMP